MESRMFTSSEVWLKNRQELWGAIEPPSLDASENSACLEMETCENSAVLYLLWLMSGCGLKISAEGHAFCQLLKRLGSRTDTFRWMTLAGLLTFYYVFLRLMDNATERDHLQDPWWASMFSTSSLWVDIMSTPLNSCHLAPGSVMAFRVRILWLHYNLILPSGGRAPGPWAFPRISVSLLAEGKMHNEKGVTGRNCARPE